MIDLHLRRFGGPTAAFELGGLRFLTDPTFDPPGDYPIGTRTLRKTRPASGTSGPVDVVLLSHDQHPDNLDTAGRAFTATAPLVLCTPVTAERLPGATRGLPEWTHIDLPRPDGKGDLRVTAVPAQHGPDGTTNVTGPVTGFIVYGVSLPTVYISGDNASLRVVSEIAERFPSIDVALLFGGRARTPLLGDANLTLDAAGMVEATRILGVDVVVPVHVDSWAHFTEGLDDVRRAFAEAGLSEALSVPE
jgi:L-ascorbate metabolism protein UlaG (beta-lactamase superfamily)